MNFRGWLGVVCVFVCVCLISAAESDKCPVTCLSVIHGGESILNASEMKRGSREWPPGAAAHHPSIIIQETMYYTAFKSRTAWSFHRGLTTNSTNRGAGRQDPY